MVCILTGLYLFAYRDLSHCGTQQLFCHDDVSARLIDLTAGFHLYEFLFWQNSSDVVVPWTDMLLLHTLISLLMAIASRVDPWGVGGVERAAHGLVFESPSPTPTSASPHAAPVRSLQMYPARLSLMLLPLNQVLQLSSLLDCARRFAAIFAADTLLRLRLHFATLAGVAVRVKHPMLQ